MWGPSFLAGGNLDITGGVAGDGWYVPAGAANGYAGDDFKVMIAQVTTDGTIDGSFNIRVYPGGDQSEEFTYEFDFSSEMCGCNDATAANYQSGATYNDGSCVSSWGARMNPHATMMRLRMRRTAHATIAAIA